VTADVYIEENEFEGDPPNSTGERRLVEGLRTPFPLINAVPPMLAEDPFVQRMLPGLDEVLAPVISTIDCFPAYLDPATAPMDMVRYVGSWLFPHIDEEWGEDALRHALATAVSRSGWRGTSRGLEMALVPYEASSVTIEDSGSVTVSSTATDPSTWPDAPEQRVTVRFTPAGDDPDAEDRVAKVIRTLIPAHTLLTLGRE
jgi:phage tail-like protein